MDNAVKEVLADRENSSPKKKKYKALFPGLVDIIEYKGEPKYLMKSGSNLEIKSHASVNGIMYYPPPPEQMPWRLPRYEHIIAEYNHYKTDKTDGSSMMREKLFDDLVAYHKSVSDLPDNLYPLIAAWDIHTYRQEEFEYSPEMAFYAVPERGKSRTGKGMIFVAYRGVHVVSIREPFIFRMAELCGASIFFDISKFWEVVEKNACGDLFLNRFEKGGQVPRVLRPDQGDFKDTKYYNVFGPTVIATNTELDDVLDTRCVTVVMQDSEREFDEDVKSEHGLYLRERLVAYRAVTMGEQFPDIGKPTKRRLGDILKPLLQVIVTMKPDSMNEALTFIQSLEKEATYRRSETLAGKLVAVMLDANEEIMDGALSLKRITEKMNEGTPEKYHYSPKRIGSMLTALGLREKATKAWKMSDGSVAIPWNEGRLKKLAEQYGISDTHENTSVSSDSSDTEESGAEIQVETDRTDQTEGTARLPNEIKQNRLEAQEAFGPDMRDSSFGVK